MAAVTARAAAKARAPFAGPAPKAMEKAETAATEMSTEVVAAAVTATAATAAATVATAAWLMATAAKAAHAVLPMAAPAVEAVAVTDLPRPEPDPS